ncbi:MULTISPECIES: TlpA family protein disulfide reductase [unclassified Sphingomonas]|uniref:TlpA family protein disulfide reductase n=1 Tax=unclassified Sphingomonas TaxID=196159 RepID=UPI000701839F|nr:MULTISPECIES: TlpA disulfide reductase family protein [unclassified Sphingomonas]KQM57295.1 thiol:disulfide interchange protein [Sphingomonas sp. Leaf16]KQN10470.1 thiol:disulfide interchange protein [Sphingomonas sp. Leaf29]KQN18271.1 thiol:disulfide interchange protein [Sphingomonas sp. Leaf32]
MRNWILPLAAALLAAAPASARELKVGQPAPPIELTLADGTKTTIAEHRGEVILVNFWATWCVPCRVELPLLDAYYRKISKHGARVFAVTTEGSVPIFKMKALFAALAITPAKGIRGIDRSVPAVPTNYIIDRQGIVRYAKAGAMDLDDLNRELIPLLREAPPES